MKKYEFTGETVVVEDGSTLRRIRSLRDFGKGSHSVAKGELGGWIESEDNLSHEGNCWVCGEAQVSGNAKVSRNAYVGGRAIICDNATVTDNAVVSEDAWVSCDAHICDKAIVGGTSWLASSAYITSKRDYLVVKMMGARDCQANFYRNKDDNIIVHRGDFIGPTNEFVHMLEYNSRSPKHTAVFKLMTELAIEQLKRRNE